MSCNGTVAADVRRLRLNWTQIGTVNRHWSAEHPLGSPVSRSSGMGVSPVLFGSNGRDARATLPKILEKQSPVRLHQSG